MLTGLEGIEGENDTPREHRDKKGPRRMATSGTKMTSMADRNSDLSGRVRLFFNRAQEVRVIGSDKENLGVMSTVKALSLASAEGLDLILVNPDGAPPVCRIMDYGKYLYEEEKKKKEARKGQSKAKSAVKELKLRPHTDVADYNVKINQAHKFLAKGNRVKVTVVFQGRDIAFKQAGADLLKRFEADVEGQGLVEGRPSSQGRQMHMLLNPTVKTTP